MVHEKRIKNEENAVPLQYRARKQSAVSSVSHLLTLAVLYRCPKEQRMLKIWHPYFNSLPVFTIFFTISTSTLTYPASQHISRAIYLHKLPRFSAGENISAPHQIKLSSSNSYWSLSSVKQPGELPGYIR